MLNRVSILSAAVLLCSCAASTQFTEAHQLLDGGNIAGMFSKTNELVARPSEEESIRASFANDPRWQQAYTKYFLVPRPILSYDALAQWQRDIADAERARLVDKESITKAYTALADEVVKRHSEGTLQLTLSQDWSIATGLTEPDHLRQIEEATLNAVVAAGSSPGNASALVKRIKDLEPTSARGADLLSRLKASPLEYDELKELGQLEPTYVKEIHESEYAPFKRKGTASISGQAFLLTRGGETRSAAGREVTLDPLTSVSVHWWNTKAATSSYATPLDDPYFKAARRSTSADIDGRFSFDNLAPGSYLVRTVVTWEVRYTQGGPVGGVVTVADGESKKVIFSERAGAVRAPDR